MTDGRRRGLPGPEIVARAIAELIMHPRREVVAPWYYRPEIWAEHALPWLADRVLRPRSQSQQERAQRVDDAQRRDGTTPATPASGDLVERKE
jgi:hypothetical protein